MDDVSSIEPKPYTWLYGNWEVGTGIRLYLKHERGEEGQGEVRLLFELIQELLI